MSQFSTWVLNRCVGGADYNELPGISEPGSQKNSNKYQDNKNV